MSGMNKAEDKISGLEEVENLDEMSKEYEKNLNHRKGAYRNCGKPWGKNPQIIE